jgi:hypothetical protein
MTHRHMTHDMTHLEHVRCVCVWENVSWVFAPRIFKLSEDAVAALLQLCCRNSVFAPRIFKLCEETHPLNPVASQTTQLYSVFKRVHRQHASENAGRHVPHVSCLCLVHLSCLATCLSVDEFGGQKSSSVLKIVQGWLCIGSKGQGRKRSSTRMIFDGRVY